MIERQRPTLLQEKIEFHGENNCYQMVRDFHVAFGHGYNDGLPIKLIMKTRVARARWMAEEVMEYTRAANSAQIEQVDALVDLLYFVLGTFVMIGVDPYEDPKFANMAEYGTKKAFEIYESGKGVPPADRLYIGSVIEWRAVAAGDVMELIFDFIDSDTITDQLYILTQIMEWTLVQAAIVGADLYPYFIIVHDANMGKLWPDGKPRYREDGKIIKPETFVDPKGEMITMMLNDLYEETDNDEIPF